MSAFNEIGKLDVVVVFNVVVTSTKGVYPITAKGIAPTLGVGWSVFVVQVVCVGLVVVAHIGTMNRWNGMNLIRPGFE
jgi:hypothetical protein